MKESNIAVSQTPVNEQVLLLAKLEESPEKYEQFFANPISYSQKHGINLLNEVITIINNSALFDDRLQSDFSKDFWIDGPSKFYEPIIYKADPTVTAAFALGALAGKVAVGAAVGAAAGAATKAVKK